MKIDIREKVCPGCGGKMKATAVDHTAITLVYIQWECTGCDRAFGFYYKTRHARITSGGLEKMNDPRRGDKITWTYEHSLNSRSKTLITKTGLFRSKCRHTAIHWRKSYAVQMAWVDFDGNKNRSRVPLDELRLAEEL